MSIMLLAVPVFMLVLVGVVLVGVWALCSAFSWAERSGLKSFIAREIRDYDHVRQAPCGCTGWLRCCEDHRRQLPPHHQRP